ncbi:MAG TPA: hypothetical protein VGK17_14500 [Propionicimonas sp.]|jgi:hypothetical protein
MTDQLQAATALAAGAGGTALFGVLGLEASVPMLLKLRRRFGSGWAPAVALAVSTTVLGPLIRGDGNAPTPTPSQVEVPAGHAQHH